MPPRGITKRVMFLPPRLEWRMLCLCIASMWFDFPIANAPPPSPMQLADAPSSVPASHDGQCAPLSQLASGAQSHAAVTTYRLPGPSPALTAALIAMLFERLPFADRSTRFSCEASSSSGLMNRP